MTFQQTAAEYIFVSSTQGLFFRLCHLLGHKIILINFRSLESYQDYNGVKLEINNRRKTGKFTSTLKLNTFLYN